MALPSVFCEVPLSSLVCFLFGRSSWEEGSPQGGGNLLMAVPCTCGSFHPLFGLPSPMPGGWRVAGAPGFTRPREGSLFQLVCPAEAPRGCPASEEGGGVSLGNPTHVQRCSPRPACKLCHKPIAKGRSLRVWPEAGCFLWRPWGTRWPRI